MSSEPTDKTAPNPERSPALKALHKHLKNVESKKFSVLYCPTCRELITIHKDKTFTCRNKCPNIHNEPPLSKPYDPQIGNYKLDFSQPDENTKFSNEEYRSYRFKPMKCAQFIKENYLFKTCKETKILYYYDPETHKWSTNGEVYLQEILGIQLGVEYRTSSYNNVLDALKAITYDDIVFGEKIAVKNGLLDVDTKELSPFTPNEMPFYSIPINYNKDAVSTIWLNFISQVVAPEDLPLIQEWSGFLLSPGYQKHKFMFMYGVGRNGKGVWSRTMRRILGKDNCVSIRLEEFNGDRRFAIARLYGKKYCECSEPLTNKTLQTPIIKALTGADNQDAEVKGLQKTLGFTNEAKITVFGNRYPRVNDNTEGFYDRFEILEFPHHFSETEQKADIEETWLQNEEDKSGILNWMLEGWQRLREKGLQFTTSKSQQEKLLELKRLSDPTGAFIEECITFSPKLFMTRKDLHDAYIEYCEEIGALGDKETAFTQRLKNTPKVKVESKRVEGKAERIWRGIGLKTLPTAENNGAKQPTLDQMNPTDAADAADASFSTPVNFLGNQKNIEGINPASSASSASPQTTQTAQPINIDTSLTETPPIQTNIVKTLNYKLIPPNQPTPCEGYNCGLEAKYNIDGCNYCDSHFKTVAKSCQENGFKLNEEYHQPEEQNYD